MFKNFIYLDIFGTKIGKLRRLLYAFKLVHVHAHVHVHVNVLYYYRFYVLVFMAEDCQMFGDPLILLQILPIGILTCTNWDFNMYQRIFP